jgi:hypothetical protein
MKNHVIKYSDWAMVSESDQRLEDLQTLVDLGMADPSEIERYRRSNYARPAREEFVNRLNRMFQELGITPKYTTTPRQNKNGTLVFQLSPEQAVKILFEYSAPGGKSKNRRTRHSSALEKIRPHIDELIAVSDRVIRSKSNVYQFFIMPADARLSVKYGEPSANRFMKFDGMDDADDLMMKFIGQVVYETLSLLHSMKRARHY